MSRFIDRHDAGRRLASVLVRFPHRRPLVLAVPNGGVVIGYEVSRALGTDLDVVVASRIEGPQGSDAVWGSVAADGIQILDDRQITAGGATPEQLRATIERAERDVTRRARLFAGSRPPPPIQDRTVYLVDDGIRTGATMRAAVGWVRARGPARIVVAVPIGMPDAVAVLAADVDDVVCLSAPPGLGQVRDGYREYTPVADEHVLRLLERARKEAPTSAPVSFIGRVRRFA